MNNYKETSEVRGFTLIELLITVSILGVLSTITMVNLSSSWTSKRLAASTRELENWLSEQRRFAINNNLTCHVIIDNSNLKLISTVYPNGSEPCIGSTLSPNAGIFDLASTFGKGHEKLSLVICPPKDLEKSEGGILFSFQGLSQNEGLESAKEYEFKSPICNKIPVDKQKNIDQLQLMLLHQDLEEQRCIRIISPIGMIRDGRTQGPSSRCHYDKIY